MHDWLTRARRTLQPIGSLRSETPRFPADGREAERVYQHWDSLNGRYYFRADVVLEDGTFLPDVLFDGDTNVAVECGGKRVSLQSGLFGREVVGYLVTQDRTPTGRYGEPTPVEREAFEAEQQRRDLL